MESVDRFDICPFETLFFQNFDHVLQIIFLNLNPSSLHNARQVCLLWNNFILTRVWGNKNAKNKLERRLETSWMLTVPEITRADYFDTMVMERNSFAIKDNLMVVGLSHVGEGGAKIVDMNTELVATLNHNFDDKFKKKSVTSVAISNFTIFTLCYPFIFVWNKEDLRLMYKLDVHLYYEQETHASLIAAGRLLVLVIDIFESIVVIWKVHHEDLEILQPKIETTGAVVTDKSWIGLSRSYHSMEFHKLDNFEEKKNLIMVHQHKDSPCRESSCFLYQCCLNYPYFCSFSNSSLSIWNVHLKSKEIRIDLCSIFWDVTLNSSRVILKNNLLFFVSSSVTFCRLNDILKHEISTEDPGRLSYRIFEITTDYDHHKIVVDKTQIVTLINDVMITWDFWPDF